MFDDVRILTLGLATVIDVVLLTAMLRRPAWRFLPVWMVLLTIGAALWHLATFVHTALADTGGGWGTKAQWIAMLTMTTGLLLMPAAMLHGACRLWQTGMRSPGSPNRWNALPYLSLLALVPAA